MSFSNSSVMKPISQYIKETLEKAKDVKSRQWPSVTHPPPVKQDSWSKQDSWTRIQSEQDFKKFQTGVLNKTNSDESIRSFHSYRTPMEGNPWTPGINARAPTAGLCALAGTFSFLSIAILIVTKANGNTIDKWSTWLQPSVLLAINYSLSSLLLSFALSVGVDISFWRRALKGTTVPELHQHWFSGSSFWGAVVGLKSLPWVSAASTYYPSQFAELPYPSFIPLYLGFQSC